MPERVSREGRFARARPLAGKSVTMVGLRQSAAARQRRARMRRRCGMVIRRVGVDEHALASALIAGKRLSEAEALQPQLVERELRLHRCQARILNRRSQRCKRKAAVRKISPSEVRSRFNKDLLNWGT
jgi:hypothetical protein